MSDGSKLACWWLVSFRCKRSGLPLGGTVVRADNARAAILETLDKGINPGGIAAFRAVEDEVVDAVGYPGLRNLCNQLISPQAWARCLRQVANDLNVIVEP